jgi:hypothetical protein
MSVAAADGLTLAEPQPATMTAVASAATPSRWSGLALERRIIDYPDFLRRRPADRGRLLGEHGLPSHPVSNRFRSGRKS